MSIATSAVPGTFTRWPETDQELWWFIRTLFGVKVPNRTVCPGHSNPFAALAEAFFARAPISVWHGSRGLAGKSFTLALLGTLEAIRYGCGVNILGGSGEQSKNVLDIMSEFWAYQRAPRHLLTSDPEGHVQIRLTNGAWIKALKASQRSVRGAPPAAAPPRRVRRDAASHFRIRHGADALERRRAGPDRLLLDAAVPGRDHDRDPEARRRAGMAGPPVVLEGVDGGA